MSFTVTATQTGAATENGMAILLKVVTGASAAQPGALAGATQATPSVSITPQQSGSWVYGSILESGTVALSALANTTFEQNVTGGGLGYYAFRSTATTTGGTPVTYGASGTVHGLSVATAEILASAAGLAEDASSPAAPGFVNAKTQTTAAFTPPAGSLLVLMVATNGNVGSVAISVTDTSGLGLTWVQQESQAVANDGYSGVWTAVVPNPLVASAAAASAVMAGKKTGKGQVSAPAAVTGTTAAATYSPQLLYYPGILHPVLWPVDYASNEPALPLIAAAAAAGTFAAARVSGDVLKGVAAAGSGSAAGVKTARGALSAAAAASAQTGGLPTGMSAAAAAAGKVTGQKQVQAALAAALAAGGTLTPRSARAQSFLAAAAFAATLPTIQPPPPVPQGSWWGLYDTWQLQKEEFDWYADVVTSEGGLSCPVCGEPLRPGPGGPSERGATVVSYCRFAGDHKYRVPEDVIRPSPGSRMGRYG